MKVAIIGSGSMIASQVSEDLEKEQVELIKGDLNQDIKIDITNQSSVDSFFKNNHFQTVILFAAFTDVNGAEEQRNDKDGICWKINVEGTSNIVNACKKYNKKLIFFSTDFIFDGKNGPYDEKETPEDNFDDISWYGITKIEGEKIIKDLLEDFIILRITYPYSPRSEGKGNMLTRLINLYKSGEMYPLYFDQHTTPTYIPDIPKAIKILLDKNQKGVFHVASPSLVSQFDFAKYATELSGISGPKQLTQKSIFSDFKNKEFAKRPVLGGLKVSKIRKLGFYPTDWKQGLEKIFKESQN